MHILRAVTYREWFKGYRGEEAEHRATIRLASETGLALGTLRNALNGRPVSPKSALRLSQATKGAVVPWSLCAPPEAS